jgi:hypothetical protein
MGMRRPRIITDFFFLFFCLAFVLFGCQAPGTTTSLTPSLSLSWQIEVSKVEIKENLNSVEPVTQYDGSIVDVVHTQSPDAGNVYLIVDVTILKTNNQSTTPFDWQWLVVKDAAGNSYHRLENGTFLVQHEYTPRITGLELRFGENTGWMCFEIPASSATGQLTLAYTAEESQQEIPLQK